jgi:hypothetical protein
MAECIEQINYLQTLIIMKATKLDKLVMENIAGYFTQEEKAQLLNTDTKNVIFISTTNEIKSSACFSFINVIV